MKKFLTILLACSLVLSMTACGGSDPAPDAAPAPAPASSSAAPAADKPAASAANPEYTPEQLAVAEKFAAMTDRFQALADKINADENLLAVEELVDVMNQMIDAVNADDAAFADPKNLTPEVLKNLEASIVAGNEFITEIESMIKNYDGKKVITINATIENMTEADLHTLAISPANDDSWGGNLLSEPLKSFESGTMTMTITEDTLVWDILAADSEGTSLEFMGLDFSDVDINAGAKITLSATEGGEYLATVQ